MQRFSHSKTIYCNKIFLNFYLHWTIFLLTIVNLFQHAVFNQSIVVHLVPWMRTSSKHSSNKRDNVNLVYKECQWCLVILVQAFLGKWWTSLKTGKIVDFNLWNLVTMIFQKVIKHKYFHRGVWLSTNWIWEWVVEKGLETLADGNVDSQFPVDGTSQQSWLNPFLFCLFDESKRKVLFSLLFLFVI